MASRLLARLAAAGLAAAGLAGCAAFGGAGGTAGSAPAIDARAGGASAGNGLTVYLDLMRTLIDADVLTQAESFREIADAVEFAPTTTNRLKHALALAVPGHPGSDAALAEQRLSALLSAGDALLPEERMLAAIHLREVEQRLILDAAAEQLRAQAEAALEQQNSESAQQLAAALEENRRLRAELDDVTQKLNALTTIEQSIRERENGAN